MTSYLVDAVLLIALAFTSIRVVGMQRELARLRTYQGEFSSIVHETAGAFDSVITAAHDSTANLAQLAGGAEHKDRPGPRGDRSVGCALHATCVGDQKWRGCGQAGAHRYRARAVV